MKKSEKKKRNEKINYGHAETRTQDLRHVRATS